MANLLEQIRISFRTIRITSGHSKEGLDAKLVPHREASEERSANPTKNFSAARRRHTFCKTYIVGPCEQEMATRANARTAQVLRRSLMRVRELMTRSVMCIHPDASLQQAAAKMKSLDIGPLPVCGD